MKVNKAHCFFEQSGTFKNEFIKLGIPAEDYDMQDNFGQTDHNIDLFKEIDNAYEGGASIFDSISCEDIIMAFFPCIYFSGIQMTYYSLESMNMKNNTVCEKIDIAIDRLDKRTFFHKMLYKMLWVASKRNIPLVIENPYHPLGYLTGIQNFPAPALIDKDRSKRGDFFVKPTAYWFFNCKPEEGYTYQPTPKELIKTVNSSKSGIRAGVCSEERSLISPDYARNFICDHIIGVEQPDIDRNLFNI